MGAIFRASCAKLGTSRKEAWPKRVRHALQVGIPTSLVGCSSNVNCDARIVSFLFQGSAPLQLAQEPPSNVKNLENALVPSQASFSRIKGSSAASGATASAISSRSCRRRLHAKPALRARHGISEF